MKAAAIYTVLGLDGMRLFTAGDPTERLVLDAVAAEALAVARDRDKALAAEIANAVGRLFR